MRLSISIGTQAATARSAQDREAIFADARGEIVEELAKRGHPLHEAAIIAEDIIDGARKLASELNAHVHQPRGDMMAVAGIGGVYG